MTEGWYPNRHMTGACGITEAHSDEDHKDPPAVWRPRYCTAMRPDRVHGPRWCSRLYGHPNGGGHRFGRHWKEEPPAATSL